MPIRTLHREKGFTPLEENKTRSVSSWPRVNTLTGFTLVEIIVATGLFAAVMLIAVGSLMSIIDANRKAQSQQIVMSNLSAAVENLSRTIRTGVSYACDTSLTSSANATPHDCSDGGIQLSFKPKEAIEDTALSSLRYVYRRDADSSGGYIAVSKDNGATYERLTAPEIDVKGLKFYVTGSCPKSSGSGCTADNRQPRVLMTVFGTAQISLRASTNFNIQTTVTQRLFDI